MRSLFIALLLVISIGIAAPVFAGSNGGNGCGVGSPPRVDMSPELKKRWAKPFFVTHGGEGRHGMQMRAHNLCVAEKSNK